MDNKFSALDRHVTLAISTLVEIMQDKNMPANFRIQASKAYLDLSLKHNRIAGLEKQIRELEAMANDAQGSQGFNIDGLLAMDEREEDDEEEIE